MKISESLRKRKWDHFSAQGYVWVCAGLGDVYRAEKCHRADPELKPSLGVNSRAEGEGQRGRMDRWSDGTKEFLL